MSKGGPVVRTRVWDAPVRVFHWLLPVLIVFSWWSVEEGRLDWHRWSGYALLSLILFRIAWGVFGSETARFSSFVRGFGAIGVYGKSLFTRSRAQALGHNPIGGWSALIMIMLIFVQSVLGLFAIDVDGIESGPLAVFVSFDQGRLAANAHQIVFNLLIGMICLHLIAVAFYAFVKRDNLIGPMITGVKSLHEAPARLPQKAPMWLAALLLVIAAGIVYAASRAFWAF